MLCLPQRRKRSHERTNVALWHCAMVHKDDTAVGLPALCQHGQKRRNRAHITRHECTSLSIRLDQDSRVVLRAVCATFPRLQADNIDIWVVLADLSGNLFRKMLVEEKAHQVGRL